MRELSDKEIQGCLRGAIRLERGAGGLLPLRFTDAAMKYYSSIGDARRIRALCPAGVSLEFLTDSSRLVIEAAIEEAARPFAFFDLYVEGSLVGSIGSEKPDHVLKGEIIVRRHPAGGARRWSLYLPHCRVTALRRVALDAGASFKPVPRASLLLALGDSITQGMTSLHPGAAYAVVAAREMEMDLHNGGVGGHVFDAAAIAKGPVEAPSIITVAYGTNDWSAGSDASPALPYLRRLRELYPSVPIYVLSVLWRPDGDEPGAGTGEPPRNKAGITLEEFRRRLAGIAGELPGVTYIPREKLLPDSREYLFDDVHPNEAGHRLMGRNLSLFIRSTIQAEHSLSYSEDGQARR